MATQLPRTRAIIVGSGFSGIAMGAQFKQQLRLDDYVIYERSPHMGGTWWANQYPGCAVDIPSIFYSLSFAPNPHFSKLFPDHYEILAYLEDVARRFEVDKHIQLNTSWDKGVWREDTKTWLVELSNVLTGETFEQECDILISAIGGLVDPQPCTIPGVASFAGPVMHTAKWRHDVVLDDKNVIVIGNGCSGSQVVPAIADKVRSVYQFFRSPQFFFPRENPRIHPYIQWAFAHVPGLMLLARWQMFHALERGFAMFSTDARGNRSRELVKKTSDDYVERTAPKEYWDMLKPAYKVGCKRRVYDPGYLKALNRDNVHITGDPIVKIEPKEVVTESGARYPADVIVLANGFVTGDVVINIVGRGGITTAEHWEQHGGIEAYKTTALSSFPNFFMLLGPNAASGHTSVVFAIEVAVDLVIKLVRPIFKGNASSVSVKDDYERQYSTEVQGALKDRVWASCKSRYNVGGGRNHLLYPWSSYTMWWQARFPDMRAWTYSQSKSD
ncbi:FAD/NAD(P)-binding domain-containing protein [Athelia psychrophila]|uniref:FAD/NAD(P)-binding domain-containing protein n=1 Tax=Athelia psychrophila TaxID=1759441 RepID=A0A167TSN4_9AGAM|nr:FAD/NAD(P)-binding domain-containing protein [Fibularhizoctonia sp. CBS 109695]